MSRRLLYAMLIFIFVASACRFSAEKATETPLPPPPAAPTEMPPTPTVVNTPESSMPETKEGVIGSLRDAEKGVVRIVTQGSYEYPDFASSLEESFTGSGFIIDPSGLAVTNNHVVAGSALIEVYLNGESEPRRASLLGVSECSDLAVIKIQGDSFPYFDWYQNDIDLGLEVYSLGYPLGDPEYTQHKGAISKKSASIQTNWTDVTSVVEHDALINPGSSGGPLVSADGEVVGINYSTLKSANQYYAITYKEAAPILDDLKVGKNVLAIGINGEAFAGEDGLSGIWIYSVASGSPADKVGIKSGDILLEMEGISLAKTGTMGEYCDILRGRSQEAVLGIKVLRYKTNEVLEGQINGRELESVGSYSGTSSGGNNTSSSNTSSSGDYFTEEFDGDFSAWTPFVMAGNPNKTYATVENKRLRFEIPSSETYVYVENVNYTYDDVYVEAKVETLRGGTNGAAIFCRGSEDGFYEARIHTQGQYTGSYEIYRYDFIEKSRGKVPYVNLMRGYERINSVDIKNGPGINYIGLLCEGNTIRFYINGKEQLLPNKEPFVDDVLSSGTVGVGAMSFSGGDVNIEFDSILTEAP